MGLLVLRSCRGVRGLWIVDAEGERVRDVCRLERRARALCSLNNKIVRSVMGALREEEVG